MLIAFWDKEAEVIKGRGEEGVGRGRGGGRCGWGMMMVAIQGVDGLCVQLLAGVNGVSSFQHDCGGLWKLLASMVGHKMQELEKRYEEMVSVANREGKKEGEREREKGTR